MKKLLFILIILLLAVVAVFTYKRIFPKPEIQVLQTARVERGDIRGVLVATGIIKPQVGAEVKIGARATGTISQMKVKIGDRVEKDQLIALIDDREIRKAVQQQKAALVSARNTLSQVKLTYPERIKEAKANYTYAKVNYEREKELLKYEYTTQDAVDQAKSQFEAADANLKRLQDEYKTQLKIAQADVDENTANLRQQEIRLTYTRIYSPIEGVISGVTAQEGETIVTGLQVVNLVTVLDPTLLEMWIYVDETDIGKIQLGQQVEYSVDTFPNKTFSGTIEKLYPQPELKDNIVYYLAIVKIDRDDAAFLKPEMTSYVKIIYREEKNVLKAPNAAIKFETGKQIVYRVAGPNNVQQTEVEIGLRGEESTEIRSGVKEGDELATKLILPVSSKTES